MEAPANAAEFNTGQLQQLGFAGPRTGQRPPPRSKSASAYSTTGEAGVAGEAGENGEASAGNLTCEAQQPQSQSASGIATARIQVHQCHLCGRGYERADHLSRHLNSHANARPYKCNRCPKSFNRADLLNRHQASHERQARGGGAGGGGISKARAWSRDRVTTACNACVASKSKCQDRKPCLRCRTRQISCETSSHLTMAHPRSTPTVQFDRIQDEAMTQELEPRLRTQIGIGTLAYENGLHHTNNANVQDRQPSTQPNAGPTQPFLPTGPGTAIATSQQFMRNSEKMSDTNPNYYTASQGPANTHDAQYDDLYNDGFFVDQGAEFNTNTEFLPWNSNFAQDIDFGIGDIDIESVELIYDSLDKTLENADTQVENGFNSLNTTKAKDISKRFAAFERSPWLWTPTNTDQTLNDQGDISLDEENIPLVITPISRGADTNEFIYCSIDSRTRDKMLALLFSLPKVDIRKPSFPSLALLNTIIQVYFAQESYKFDQFIHSTSLSSVKSLPHLAMAIISGGSILISTPAIWKMGLALQEVVRHTIGNFWEQNNSNTRNIQALQAFMICLDVGLWSGFKRKMEIAESFAQPVIIMLRRAGAFNNQDDGFVLEIGQDNSEADLEMKWRKWLERESMKRLVLHLFFHDVYASAGLQKPPLITLTELKFGLPASRELWTAKTAMEWRDIYLRRVPQNYEHSTFMDVLGDPDSLHSMTNYVDVHLCAMTLLHGYWNQLWTLSEAKKFYPASRTTHHLSLLTSHRELYRDLLELADRMPSLTRNSPAATLLSEFFMMIMYVSPEDLQRFAGKSGEEEASRAYAAFQLWTKTSESRLAIWHAGQVLRAAREVMPTQLRCFNAIITYYASLTLWVYGLVAFSDSSNLLPTSEEQHGAGTISPTPTRPSVEVILNDAESAYLRTFKASGRGVPGISILYAEGTPTFVPLRDTDKILAISRHIYRSNFPVADEPLPTLVANLSNLLKDLSSLPGSRMSRATSRRPQ